MVTHWVPNLEVKLLGHCFLGLYDKEGKPVYVGKVGTGFTEKMLGILMDKFEKLKTDIAPFKPETGDTVTWLEPKLVCEVAFQIVTKDMRLRMPRFKGLREDKSPADCTFDQLVEIKKIDRLIPKMKLLKRIFLNMLQNVILNKPLNRHGGEKKGEKQIFVVQEHHARALHYDLRLEKDGVLKSWAVPKGIPETAAQRHLAVETEDHPFEYASFEGSIPKGQYGAGTVKIWDKGHYETKFWDENKIEVTLHGQRLKGRYVLVWLKRANDKQKSWLLLKGKD